MQYILVHSDDEKDQKYGIPEQKKFPMPDAKHVKSAIKFFNYVDPRHEKELANAIISRMEEYGLTFDDIGVGEGNRFSKYVPKKEETLKHHGILGQKWGVRRYQNPDGSLTPEGLERYRKAGVELTDAAYSSKAYKKAVERMNEAYKPVKDYYNLSEKERDKYIRKASDAAYDRYKDQFDPQTEAKDRERMFELYKYDDLDQGRDGSFKYYLEDKGINPHKFSENAYKANKRFKKDMERAVNSALNELASKEPSWKYGHSPDEFFYDDLLNNYDGNEGATSKADIASARAFVNSIIEDISQNTRGSIGFWYDLLEI